MKQFLATLRCQKAALQYGLRLLAIFFILVSNLGVAIGPASALQATYVGEENQQNETHPLTVENRQSNSKKRVAHARGEKTSKTSISSEFLPGISPESTNPPDAPTPEPTIPDDIDEHLIVFPPQMKPLENLLRKSDQTTKGLTYQPQGLMEGGQLLSPIAGGPSHQNSPAIVYNTVRNESLVVWVDEETTPASLRGMRISNDGIPLADAFLIISGITTKPERITINYSPVSDSYFLAWVEFNGYSEITYCLTPSICRLYSQSQAKLYALPLQGDGNPSITTPTVISDQETVEYDIAYNSQDNDFAVAWSEPPGSYLYCGGNTYCLSPNHTVVQRFAPDGTGIGSAQTAISPTSGNVTIEYNPTDNNYMLVSMRWFSSYPIANFYAQVLPSNLSPTGIIPLSYTRDGDAFPTLTYFPDNSYLLTWLDYHGSPYWWAGNVNGRLIGASNAANLTGIRAFLNVYPGYRDKVVVEYNSETGTALISAIYDGSPNLVGAYIDGQANSIAPETISRNGSDFAVTSIPSNTSPSWLVAWTHNGDIYVRNVSLTKVLDESTINWGEIKKRIKEIAAEHDYEISSISCTQADCGDPINTRTGVFSFASPDISFPSTAGNLVFQTAYSSGAIDTYTDTLGYGWTHNHDARLIFPSDPGGKENSVIFKDMLGNQYIFTIQSDGSLLPGVGVLATLEKFTTPNLIYTLTTPEQARLEFDETGKILSRSDAQGNSFDYVYDDGNLIRVSADQGTRYLDISYDEQDRIISVADHTGRQVSYAYDLSGNLVTSTDLLGRTWSYTYDASHHMTQVIDPTDRETVTNEYDVNGRVWRQFDGEGNRVVEIEYNENGSTIVYDAQNNAQTHISDVHNIVTEKQDELGRITNTDYDENFRPTNITNAAGHTLKMEWSADGKNLLSKTDPAGGKTTYTYDALNNLTSTTDSLGNVTTYTYEGKLLLSKTNPDNKTTTYTYTIEGWLETETDAYDRVTSYTYDMHGQKTSVTDWRGQTTTYTYDELGRLIETTDPRGRVSRNEYNAAGQLLSSISNFDPNRPQNDENLYNITTTYEYDVRGNQIAVTDSLGRVTRYEYDNADRLVSTIDPDGNVTTNVYDERGLLASTTDALDNLTSYVYDEVGRRLTTINALGQSSGTTNFNIPANTSTAIDALGRSATYYYDELNRVVKVVDPLGNETTTSYNASGNVSARTDALGRITRFEYDGLGRLVRTIDPMGGITQTVYDTSGNRVATIDPLGNQTSYAYDDQGRLISTTDALGNISSNQYDEDGNLVKIIDALGNTTTNQYDQWGRLIATIKPGGRSARYTYDMLDRIVSTKDWNGSSTVTYDALGNVTARTDGYGRTSTTTYDVLGRVISTTDFKGNTTSNEYDAVGNLISTTNGLGTTTYTYDALNRRISTTDHQGNTNRVAYDVLGNVTDETDANGIVTHFIYDELNRQVAIIHNYRPTMVPDAETNVRVDYTYNAVGNRTHIKDANGNITEFQYDALNRVTHKIDPLGNTWIYEYDLAGNMISRTDGNNQTTYFTYDALRQLTLIDYPEPDADVSFTYNAIGQRNSMTDGLGTTTWNYDDLGRLVSVIDPREKTVSYSYDEQGNRVGLEYPDGKLVAYNYDEDNHLADVADWDSQSTEYEYDSLGRLLSILRPNGVASSYAFDETGRLALLEHTTDAGMLAKFEYTYDAVGNIIQAREHTSGATAISPTVLVTVVDTGGVPLVGETVYAVSESAYANHSQVTDEQGQALFSLPNGTYRFRVEVDGIQFWSGTEEHCQIGSCEQVLLTIPQPVLVTVLDSDQVAQAGLSVSAYSGTTSAGVSGTTDENGQVQLRLPAGDYRFQADFNGTPFWSEGTNHCQVPGCTMAQINVNLPVTVTVSDSVWNAVPGQTVYAYLDSTYSGFSALTNDQGQAQFTLPSGDYRFRTEFGGETFWSDASESCSVPGCSAIDLRVALPLAITVLNTQGQPVSDVFVEVFDGEDATGQSGTTGAEGTTAFTLPVGSYRFRATYQNIEYWSGEENHCEVFLCSGATITVSEPALPTPTPTASPEPTTTATPASGGFNPLPEIPGTPGPGTFSAQSDKTKVLHPSGVTGKSILTGETDVIITVLDADGNPREGVPLLAFDDATPTEYSGTSDANGQVTLSLPDGNYRFRAEFNLLPESDGVYYWSGTENHCTVPECDSAMVTVALPVKVNVHNPDTNSPHIGATVYAYQGMTDTGYSSITDENGDAYFTLPIGSYHFMIELDNVQFFSEEFDHCDVPNCRDTGIWAFGARHITVRQKDGTLVENAQVEAYTETAYTGLSGITDENGVARITLPFGMYRFRIQVPSGEYWSGEQVHCKTPECRGVTVVVDTFDTIPISVLNTYGEPQGAGHTVTAFTGDTSTEQSADSDDNGQAILTLLEGNYRFHAIYEGATFWSETDNHCAIPGCSGAIISVTLLLHVTVRNSAGQPVSGADVYAFDGDTYTNFSRITNEEGLAYFILPFGSYRFRVDVDGTQFWSGAENHLTLPSNERYLDITINKPVTVSVVKQGGSVVADTLVAVYQGQNYIGQTAATGADGKVTFNLPDGAYRFRVEYGGQEYWSEVCPIPGCESASVTLPGEIVERDITIDYTYDALNRLTSATYSNSIAFHYTYDAAGNVLEYNANANGIAATTTYTYDAANQLLAATKDSTTWHYTYDGNGSLVESIPAGSNQNGAKRYSYNIAGFLVQVETYANGWQIQAKMAYDGLGNRLEMTGYADGQSLTTQYKLDNGRVLSADADGNVTYYLYGLGPIGELTTAWAYSLPDGGNTPRQLVNAAGEITLTSSYTPWGDTLEVYGSDSFTQGYFGGVMDAATGLIYVGNGQYYDPESGRFLTRDARPEQNNPYTPIDPTGAMLAPLALLAMVFGRKKSRGKWDTLIILLVLSLSLGMGLAACGPTPVTITDGTNTVTITSLETPTPTQTPPVAVTVSTPTATETYILTPTATPTLPAGCANGVWWTGYDEDAGNLEIIAKRLYFEGASSFHENEIRKNVFMAQAWALRTLQAYLYIGQSYTWITQNAFSVSSQKDGATIRPYDNDYLEITRCILNSEHCAYGSNPWISKAPGKAVQWISPQNLNRRNASGGAVTFKSDKISGCNTDEGCQLPDLRSQLWIKDIENLVGSVESFVDLGAIDTTGDGRADFSECYWKGLYFFADHNSFQTAANGTYNDPPTSGEQTSLKCPQGVSGERLELPPMPNLYSSP